MKETSAGAVVCRIEKKPLFLLLHYQEGHWGFPKGHVENGETLLDTASREIEEETGIKSLQFIDGFEKVVNYTLARGKEDIQKTVTFFLAMTDETKVTISDEHTDSCWLLADEALEKITYENEKQILRKALDIISKAF